MSWHSVVVIDINK